MLQNSSHKTSAEKRNPGTLNSNQQKNKLHTITGVINLLNLNLLLKINIQNRNNTRIDML